MRVLQVGLGAWGASWADVVREVPEVEGVGWVDPSPAALADAPEGMRTYASLMQALDELEGAARPDAVLITAGLNAHAPIAHAALEAGLHVLVEKPFVPTMREARSLVEQAAAAERILMVSQNYRFHAGPQRVAELLREQRIGRIGAARIDFRKRFGQPPEHAYRRGLQPLLLDMFVHHADLMRFLLDREPVAVHCVTWNPPWSTFRDPASGSMVVDFGEDLVVTWRGTWESMAPPTLWSGEWWIEGEHGAIAFASRGNLGEPAPDWVQLFDGHERADVPLEPWTPDDRHGALTAFAEAVATGVQPTTSGRDNLGTLALCLAAIRAAEEGRRVHLDEITSE